MIEATKLNQKLQQRIMEQGIISWFDTKKAENGDNAHESA